MMRVAISIAEHEKEMAHRWMDWVAELGGTEGHHLHLIPASGVDIGRILPKADKAFGGRVTIIVDHEAQESDWQNTDPLRSAAGPNSSFRQIAWHFYLNKLGPFFWCELDCIPIRKDWLDKLEWEYKSCGKPFMGAHVLLESVPEHMSGNAVYPQNVPEEAPTLVMRTEWTPKGQDQAFELAFDIAGAREVVPKAHFTNLIQHKFRYEGFKSRQQFDEVIDPNAVVFHSDKSGSIYFFLRENLSGGVESRHAEPKMEAWRSENQLNTPVSRPDSGSSAPPAQRAGSVTHVLKDGNYSVKIKEPKLDRPTYSYSDILARVSDEPSGLPPISEPWKNKAESETEVRLLCSALALFCKAPLYKSRVRQALREAKIIK